MRRNGHKTTSGVKFDSRFEFSVPDFLYGGKFWKLDHDFRYFFYFLANFLLLMHRNGQNFPFSQLFNPEFEIPMVVSYSNMNFGGASAKFYTCFAQKTAFVM